MPLVLGQSAFYSRSYARFTEKWLFYLTRESCWRNEWNVDRRCTLTIDRRCTLTIDRRWCQNVGWAYFMTDWSPEATTNYQKALGRPKPLFMLFLSHCSRLRFLLFIILILGLERTSIILQRLIGTPFILPLIYLSIIQTMICVTACMSK